MREKTIDKGFPIGLDTIILHFDDFKILTEETYIFLNDQGQQFGSLNRKKSSGYELTLNLPKFLRLDNKTPFRVIDAICLEKLLCDVRLQLYKLFGKEVMPIVRLVEVNSTGRTPNKVNIDNVMHTLLWAFLGSEAATNVYIIGKPVKGCKVFKRGIVESFETPRATNARYTLKIYNKSREQEEPENNLLRLEYRFNTRGIETAFGKKSVTLDELLTRTGIETMIQAYAVAVTQHFVPQVKDFIYDCKNLVYKALEADNGMSMFENILAKQDIVKLDWDILRKALHKYYKVHHLTCEAQQLAYIKKKWKKLYNEEPADGTINFLCSVLQEIKD